MSWRAHLNHLTDRAGSHLARGCDALLEVVGSDRQAFIMLAGLVFLAILVMAGKIFYRLLSL